METILASNIIPAIVFYQPIIAGTGDNKRLIIAIGTDKDTGEVLIVAKKPEEVTLIDGYLEGV